MIMRSHIIKNASKISKTAAAYLFGTAAAVAYRCIFNFLTLFKLSIRHSIKQLGPLLRSIIVHLFRIYKYV